MKLDILFVIDPLESLVKGHDTSLAVMEECVCRKHNVWYCTLKDLRMTKSKPFGTLKLVTKKKDAWQTLSTEDKALDSMSIIFMRKDPPFNIDYIMGCTILAYVSKKTHIINNPDALRTFNEKLGIFEFAEHIPDTVVTKSKEEIIKFSKKHAAIVLKPLDLNSGQNIFVMQQNDKNRDSLISMMTNNQQNYIMIQEYLPAVKNGDRRVIILNGKIIGILNRIAPAHDHRSNLHTGATAKKVKLTKENLRVCNEIAEKLKAKGIYFAGLDLIGDSITEINITSPTGIVEINKLYGVQLEREIVNFFEELAK